MHFKSTNNQDISNLKSFLENLPRLNDKDREKRIKKTKKDFFFFIKTYFSHHIDNSKKETSIFRDFIHKNIESLTSKHKVLLFTAYRGGAKSTTIAKLYPLWQMIKKNRRYIIQISSTDTLSKMLLEFISEELSSNSSLKSDFNIEVKKDIAGAVVADIDNFLLKFECYGAGAKIRGITFISYRPDLIIVDDIENDENVEVKAQRDKLHKWYKKAIKKLVSRLNPNYNIIIIGTILHHDSVLARLSKSPNIYYKDFPLVLDFKTYKLDDSRIDKKEVQAEFEEDYESCMQEYQNTPLSQENLLFNGYEVVEVMPKCDFYSIGIDPSLGKKTSDYFAISIIGHLQETKKFYLLSLGFKKEAIKMISEILKIYISYSAIARCIISVETVAFQKFYKDVLKDKANELGIHPVIKEINNRINKELRIQTLSPPIVEKDILIVKASTLLIEELDTYPKSPHDDLLDSAEMAYRGFSFGTVNYALINKAMKRKRKQFLKLKDTFC